MPVYFLHAEFDLRNPVDGDAPDRDCVHTVGGPKPLPPQVVHDKSGIFAPNFLGQDQPYGPIHPSFGPQIVFLFWQIHVQLL